MKIVKIRCKDAEVNLEEVKKEFEKRFSRYKHPYNDWIFDSRCYYWI